MDPYRFDGKRVLVLGGASGMGNAAARLGAELGGEVTILDVREPLVDVGEFRTIDLRSRQSIDDTLAGLAGTFDAVLCCSGIADGPDLPKVNFIGQRHLVERAIERGLVGRGGAIAMISSIGGISWPDNLDTVLDFLATPDFERAETWMAAHPELAHYGFAKQAVIVYCAQRARSLVDAGIRINCTAPGPTHTPLMAANPGWEAFDDAFEQAMGRRGSTPEEQAWPLLFLVSDAASFVSGTCLVVDLGFTDGGRVGAVESPMLGVLLPKPAVTG